MIETLKNTTFLEFSSADGSIKFVFNVMNLSFRTKLFSLFDIEFIVELTDSEIGKVILLENSKFVLEDLVNHLLKIKTLSEDNNDLIDFFDNVPQRTLDLFSLLTDLMYSECIPFDERIINVLNLIAISKQDNDEYRRPLI